MSTKPDKPVLQELDELLDETSTALSAVHRPVNHSTLTQIGLSQDPLSESSKSSILPHEHVPEHTENKVPRPVSSPIVPSDKISIPNQVIQPAKSSNAQYLSKKPQKTKEKSESQKSKVKIRERSARKKETKRIKDVPKQLESRNPDPTEVVRAQDAENPVDVTRLKDVRKPKEITKAVEVTMTQEDKTTANEPTVVNDAPTIHKKPICLSVSSQNSGNRSIPVYFFLI